MDKKFLDLVTPGQQDSGSYHAFVIDNYRTLSGYGDLTIYIKDEDQWVFFENRDIFSSDYNINYVHCNMGRWVGDNYDGDETDGNTWYLLGLVKMAFEYEDYEFETGIFNMRPYVKPIYMGYQRIIPFIVPDRFFNAGTSSDPYLITHPNLLKHMANSNKHFKLVRDITIPNGFPLEPIPSFSGVFDGNYKNISYVSINNSGGSGNYGLFDTNSGTIKNLTVQGYIHIYGGAGNTGIIAGINNGNIENIIALGSLIIAGGSGNTGIVAGRNNGNINNVEAYGGITITGGTGYTGIVAGINSGAILNCYNCPYPFSSAYMIADTSAAGTTATVGGIAGVNAYNGYIYGCTNNGGIYSAYRAGGIVGDSFGSIYNSRNNGDIDYRYMGVAGNGYIGGIAGYMDGGEINGAANNGIISYKNGFSSSTAIQPCIAHIVGYREVQGGYEKGKLGPDLSWLGVVDPGALTGNQALYVGINRAAGAPYDPVFDAATNSAITLHLPNSYFYNDKLEAYADYLEIGSLRAATGHNAWKALTGEGQGLEWNILDHHCPPIWELSGAYISFDLDPDLRAYLAAQNHTVNVRVRALVGYNYLGGITGRNTFYGTIAKDFNVAISQYGYTVLSESETVFGESDTFSGDLIKGCRLAVTSGTIF
jgi:hypothetical protein